MTSQPQPYEIQMLEAIRELSAAEAARLLGRGQAWVSRHMSELGGYRDGPGDAWHIPVHAIKRYQERRAVELAEELRQHDELAREMRDAMLRRRA